MKKTFVLDTNVLLSDPNSLHSFDDNDLIIPMAVLEELDAHKSRPDEVGRNARQVSREFDNMRIAGGSLVNGVKLASGGLLKVVSIGFDALSICPAELKTAKVDNLIIAFMLHLKKTVDENNAAILVSKDINVRIKCDSLGIKCDDYLKMRITSDAQQFYKGVSVVQVEDSALIDQLFLEGEVSTGEVGLIDKKLYPNEIVIVKNVNGEQTKSAVTRCVGEKLIPIKKIESVSNLKPRNKEQNFSLDLLLDPDVKLITLVGPSGTGKTLLALAAALYQLKPMAGTADRGIYEKLIVTRPIQPIGKDIGFLPGTLEEKMEPWIAPIRDNLNFLMGAATGNGKRRRERSVGDETYLSLLQQSGIVEIEAITFIRGRSIPNAFIVIDEAQNLSMHELKTIITRAGDGTKIVLTGDIEQIDNVHVDAYTNGLTYAIEKFKEHSIAGHVTLLKGERSQLATIASQIL